MKTKEIAQTFLKELQAEDPDDFHVLDIRIAALVEDGAGRLTLNQVYDLLQEVRQP